MKRLWTVHYPTASEVSFSRPDNQNQKGRKKNDENEWKGKNNLGFIVFSQPHPRCLTRCATMAAQQQPRPPVTSNCDRPDFLRIQRSSAFRPLCPILSEQLMQDL